MQSVFFQKEVSVRWLNVGSFVNNYGQIKKAAIHIGCRSNAAIATDVLSMAGRPALLSQSSLKSSLSNTTTDDYNIKTWKSLSNNNGYCQLSEFNSSFAPRQGHFSLVTSGRAGCPRYGYSSVNYKRRFAAAYSTGPSTNSEFSRPAFFDYQSTTPTDPRVVDKMLPLFIDVFGNPHSRSHLYGWETEDLVEEARVHVAKLINAQPKNIIFTSGATESNNMAIKGVAGFYSRNTPTQKRFQTDNNNNNSSNNATPSSSSYVGPKNHIITTQIEHKCVLQSCRHLQENGWEVTYLPVDSNGIVNLSELEEAIIPGKTLLCSIMHVNNEIGVVQDITGIGAICRRNNVFFHTDAAQGVGKVPIDVEESKVDLLSISAHKLYGPMGIGALYVRSKPRVRLSPIIDGGGQERGLRSGTLPAPIVVGFGEAARIALDEMESDKRHINRLFNMLKDGITSHVSDVTINGSLTNRYFGNLNLSFAFVEGESLIMAMPDIAVSSGSACTSASLEPSYVLRALGISEELAHTSIRFGIGRFTTEEEVNHCVKSVCNEIKRLRELSPLYEMALEERATGKKVEAIWT